MVKGHHAYEFICTVKGYLNLTIVVLMGIVLFLFLFDRSIRFLCFKLFIVCFAISACYSRG